MKNLLLLTAGVVLIFLSGCENNDLLLSEKKLNSKIQKDWRIVSPSPAIDKREIWSFANGGVKIQYTKNDSIYSVPGNYVIDARATKSYVSITDFTFTNYLNSGFTAADLNRKWTIVELEGGVMYLSGIDDRGNIRSIEFIEN
jgi:hypothetical protein